MPTTAKIYLGFFYDEKEGSKVSPLSYAAPIGAKLVPVIELFNKQEFWTKDPTVSDKWLKQS